jgi:hypothetical protein
VRESGVTREVRAFAVTVLALATLGIGAGILWSGVSPRAPYQVTEQGAVLADPTTQALIAADGWFTVITGGLGLLCGAVAWPAGRRWMVGVLLGLCAGGMLGAFLTWWTGSTFTIGAVAVEAAAAPGAQIVPGALTLTASGVLVAWPILAVGLFGLLEGMHGYRESPLRQPYGDLPSGNLPSGEFPSGNLPSGEFPNRESPNRESPSGGGFPSGER